MSCNRSIVGLVVFACRKTSEKLFTVNRSDVIREPAVYNGFQSQLQVVKAIQFYMYTQLENLG